MQLLGKKISTVLQSILYVVSLSLMIYIGYSRANNNNWPEEKREANTELNEKSDKLQNFEIHALRVEDPDSININPNNKNKIIRTET